MSWIQSDVNYIPPEPYIPCEWATGSDAEIVEALEKHYAGRCDLNEYWSIGDERVVSLSAMSAMSPLDDSQPAQDVILVLSNAGGKYLADGVTECLFQVDQKGVLSDEGMMDSSGSNIWKTSQRRTWCNSIYYNAIPSTLRPIFKQFINQSGLGNGSTSGVEDTIDYFALRAEIEIFNSVTYSVSGEGSIISYYRTSANRKKQYNNVNLPYFLRSPRSDTTSQFCIVSDTGGSSYYSADIYRRLAPFGVI